MTSSIIDFIEARLAEDEAAARAAIADDGGQDGGLEDAFGYLTSGEILLPRFGEPLAKLITTFAIPRRVLREVAAKRAILTAYRPADGNPHPGLPCTEDLDHDPEGRNWDEDSLGPCERHVEAMKERRGQPVVSEHVLRYLASTYSDHPDYQQEWATDPS